MREIKFRAWDNVNKAMLQTRESWLKTWKDAECDPDNDYDFKKLELYVSQDGHVLEDTYEHGVCDLHYYLQGNPKYELMQFTGLKDKNGTEIYEGDIFCITREPREDNVVEFYEGEYHLEDHGLNLSDWYERGEVVGNIYENPELLKAKE